MWNKRLIGVSLRELPFLRAALTDSRFSWVFLPVSYCSGSKASHPYRRLCFSVAWTIFWTTNFQAIPQYRQQSTNQIFHPPEYGGGELGSLVEALQASKRASKSYAPTWRKPSAPLRRDELSEKRLERRLLDLA